MRGHCSFCW